MRDDYSMEQDERSDPLQAGQAPNAAAGYVGNATGQPDYAAFGQMLAQRQQFVNQVNERYLTHT